MTQTRDITDRPAPRCWSCGYELTGLRVEDRCPECGEDVWSSSPTSTASALAADSLSRDAASARNLGIAAIVLCLLIGPLALAAAIPAILRARRVLRAPGAGALIAASMRGAKLGAVLGWITVGLSAAWLVVLFVF